MKVRDRVRGRRDREYVQYSTGGGGSDRGRRGVSRRLPEDELTHRSGTESRKDSGEPGVGDRREEIRR